MSKRKLTPTFHWAKPEKKRKREDEDPQCFWEKLFEMGTLVSSYLIDKYQIKIFSKYHHFKLKCRSKCGKSKKHHCERLAPYWHKIQESFPIQCEKLAKTENLNDELYQDKRALRLQCRTLFKQWDSSFFYAVHERCLKLVSFLQSTPDGRILARISQGKSLEIRNQDYYYYPNRETQDCFLSKKSFPTLEIGLENPDDLWSVPQYWKSPIVLQNHDATQFDSEYKWFSGNHGIWRSNCEPEDPFVLSNNKKCMECSMDVLPGGMIPPFIEVFFQSNGTLKGYASEKLICIHGKKQKFYDRLIVTILVDEMQRNLELKKNYQPDWCPSCLWILICDYYP